MKKVKFQTLKDMKGITLIALIITIIVLLILAGISITMLTGDNSILGKATSAKEETRGATVEEQKELWVLEKNMSKNSKIYNARNLDEVLNDLENSKLINIEERNEIEQTGKVTIGSRTIVFEVIPNWKRKDSNSIINREETTVVKIGDYVGYNPKSEVDIENIAINQYISSGEKNGYRNQTFKLSDCRTNWRILGVEDGKIKIVSYNGIGPSEGGEAASSGYSSSSDGLVLYGRAGVEHGTEELNNISKLYANGKYSIEGRSININDILDIFELNREDFLVTEKIEDINTRKIYFGWENVDDRGQRFSLAFVKNSNNSDYWIADKGSFFLNGKIHYGIQHVRWQHVDVSAIYSSDGTEAKLSHPVLAVIYLDENINLVKNGKIDGCDFWEIQM